MYGVGFPVGVSIEHSLRIAASLTFVVSGCCVTLATVALLLCSLILVTYFERISICVILINCVTLGLFDPSDPNCVTDKCHVLERVETSIYAFFALEMLVKWIAMGLFGKLGYFADSWNRLDFFIVAAG